jgi:uncharacterized protein (DUF2164 family)
MAIYYEYEGEKDSSWNIEEMKQLLSMIEPMNNYSDQELELMIEIFVRDNILEVLWDDEGNTFYRLTPFGKGISKKIKSPW